MDQHPIEQVLAQMQLKVRQLDQQRVEVGEERRYDLIEKSVVDGLGRIDTEVMTHVGRRLIERRVERQQLSLDHSLIERFETVTDLIGQRVVRVPQSSAGRCQGID